MLSDLLQESCVQTGAQAENWRQAAALAGKMLEQAGAVEPRYLDAMVQTVENCGAYMVLTKGFALLHARPEDGANKTCAALLTLEQAVEFGAGDKDPVGVVMAFASPEPDAHVYLIQDVATLLMCDGFLEELCACATPAAVLDTIRRCEAAGA